MRVCWAVYGELDQPTGGYVYDRLVVEGLRARGDAVEVVDLRERPSLPGLREDGGPFDVVVGDALCVPELGPGFEALPRETARVLLVHHLGSWEVERADRGGLRAVEARAIAAADRLVVTGQATGARLSGELPGRPVDVVAPGADRLPRYPRGERGQRDGRDGRDDRRVDLLFVGSQIPRKRLPVLLDAVERLGAKELTLTLAGDAGRDPAHASEIARRIRGSPALRAAVRDAGVLGDDALARAMAGADALVLPSSLEGYGMVLTEAIHAGLAVIASRPAAVAAGLVSSATNAADAADAAMVFDDLEGLVRVLRAFVDDPVLRATMQRAARGTPLPTWSEAVDAFRAVLTRAVAGGPARDRAPSTR